MNNILIYYSCLDFDKNSMKKKNHTESNIYPNEKKANANPRLRNIKISKIVFCFSLIIFIIH